MFVKILCAALHLSVFSLSFFIIYVKSNAGQQYPAFFLILFFSFSLIWVIILTSKEMEDKKCRTGK